MAWRSSSARAREAIAATIAAGLVADPAVGEVWLEGALAVGLAHARSDVDLRVIVERATAPELRSRVVDGVRVDLAADTRGAVDAARRLLGSFDVRFDDVEVFRHVRAEIGSLTRLRTALRYVPAGWRPVITDPERDVYRRWAVADQVEQIHSLTEDLLGLLDDRMYFEADLVWRQLMLCLATLECAAAGEPLLGTKWLPALWRRTTGQLATADALMLSLAPMSWGEDTSAWFAPVRQRVTDAILRCWPDLGEAEDAPPAYTLDPGWLPQRYADGWFVRLGDHRTRLSPGQFRRWRRTATQ
ncbi:MAG: hypothetical protein HY241_00570 [Actinobacteria bacterium]|nr:hypothetical protein [Actinomycetota bacterium]